MSNDLVTPAELAHLPGAPFSDIEVDAAVAAVRAAAGWHIAPVREETITLDVAHCESWLRLPTQALVSVDEIRDADTGTVIDAARYRVSERLAQVRKRSGYWPHGYGRIEVDLTHGFDTAPAELLAVIAEAATTARRDQSVTQQTAGPFSVSLGNGGASYLGNPIGTGAILESFRLRFVPGIA
jgi:hypothetical protein